MIKIKRYAPEDIGVDIKLIEKLKDETEKAKLHYASELGKLEADSTYKIETFSFKTYGKTKPDLIKVYNGKCAYCEASILHGQPGDVEHFRPKSAINTSTDGIESLSSSVIKPKKEDHEIKPGYYWLAADWYNLLLSCNSCNRLSKQLNTANNEGSTISNDTLDEETLGKGARFPYIDFKKRIGNPETAINEEKDIRLLIDPGEDDPEEHLTFVKYKGRKTTLFDIGEVETEEKFGMIKALSDKGIASIQIFGLARWKLLQEREKAALHLMGDLADLKKAVTQFIEAWKELKKDPANEFIKSIVDNTDETITDKMGSLTAQFKNSSIETSPSQFLGMKRVILKNWIEEENSIVKELENRGIEIDQLLILDMVKDLNFITNLARDFKDASDAGYAEIEEMKKKGISKVWDSLSNELKANSPNLKAKKSLLKQWITNISNVANEVIKTLISLNKNPNDLIT